MSVKRMIVEADVDTMNVTRFCAVHGISTWSFWNLRKRFALEGEAALEPRSRAPHTVANRTPAHIEERIVRARKDLDDQGWDCGPASIWNDLEGFEGLPSESTIWRILGRHGLIVPDPSKAPKTSKSWTAERANQCWALDDTEFELADRTEVKILNVLDDHSRLAACCTPMLSCTGVNTFHAMAHAATWLGWPERFWSDNAKAFKETLARAVAPLGVISSQTRPYSPKSNGKAERFHQTQAKWLAKQPVPETLTELAELLEWFRMHYNLKRRHRSIGRRTPAQVWDQAPKTGPASKPLNTPTSTHHTKVINGTITASQYRISVGAAYTGQHALTIITGTRAHIFIDTKLIRELTINPHKHIQPMYNKPGRPTMRNDPRHA